MDMHRLNLAVILVFLLSVSCSPLRDTPVYGPGPFELTTSNGGDVETVASAVAPSTTCPGGRIVVNSGSGYRFVVRKLINPDPAPYDVGIPWGTAQGGSYDNGLVRLANGDLLAVRAAGLTAPDGTQPRAAFALWRTSCGDSGTWSGTPMVLDSAAVAATDPSNNLLPGYCKGFGLSQTAGIDGSGFDREELYADPWGVTDDPGGDTKKQKQRIYLSTACTVRDLTGKTLDDSVAIFVSGDSGQTWNASTLRLLWTGSPAAMTSTSSGRFFVGKCETTEQGSQLTLRWSDDHGVSFATPPEGLDVTYDFTDKGGNRTRLDCDALSDDLVGVGQPLIATVSLARAGPNSVLVVYPALTDSPDLPGIKRQVAAVVLVTTYGATRPQDAVVSPAAIIRTNNKFGNVLQPAFIQDDRKDAFPATTMLYWVETEEAPLGQPNIPMRARYSIFQSGLLITDPPKLLSDLGGWTETGIRFRGDYMYGGFFAEGDAMNFVAVWPQNPQLYARIITLIPSVTGTWGLWRRLPAPTPDGVPGARPAARSLVAVAPKCNYECQKKIKRERSDRK